MIDSQMANLDNPGMNRTTSDKFGDRVAELLPLAQLTARELADATGVAYSKLSKWKGEPEKRPLIVVTEAWAIAHELARKTGLDARKILMYLIDDDQPDGTPLSALLSAWQEKLDGNIVRETVSATTELIRSKPTKGPRPRKSRAQAKRKHLAG